MQQHMLREILDNKRMQKYGLGRNTRVFLFGKILLTIIPIRSIIIPVRIKYKGDKNEERGASIHQ